MTAEMSAVARDNARVISRIQFRNNRAFHDLSVGLRTLTVTF
jgi:hypothetical protein